MPFYLCDLVGSGGDDDPCQPAIADHVGAWSGVDARVDPANPRGTMIVEATPDDTQAAAIAADPRIAPISDDAAPALIAAMLASGEDR